MEWLSKQLNRWRSRSGADPAVSIPGDSGHGEDFEHYRRPGRGTWSDGLDAARFVGSPVPGPRPLPSVGSGSGPLPSVGSGSGPLPGVGSGSGPHPGAARSRIAELIARREQGGEPNGRPRGNPAFSEAVFVELMRAQQYRRAFDLLAPDCQRQWGTLSAFAAAQARGALKALQGVNVNNVRHLDEWTDPETSHSYRHVAELDVEYSLGTGERSMVVERTIHLIAADGKWRSLCYPVAAAAAEHAS